MTPEQFAEKVKSKYPQYANVDNGVLVQKMLEKYPQYQSHVSGFSTQTPEEVEKPGFFSQEITGGADTAEAGGIVGFGKRLFQSTLGSKGLLGVAQLPGKVIGQRGVLESQEELSKTKSNLVQGAVTAMRKIQETEDHALKERLTNSLLEIDKQLSALEVAELELGRFVATPKEALGTALNAAATVAPIGKGGFVSKTLREATRGAGFSAGTALSEDRTPTARELATGATIGAVAPAVIGASGRVASKVLGITRQIGKSLAGSLGVSVDEIFANPKVAQQTAEKLLGGKETLQSMLRESAEGLLNKVGNFRKSIRESFGEALSTLKSTDIEPSVFRRNIQQVLDKFGVSINEQGAREFGGVEFTKQNLLNKASTLVDDVSSTRLDGLSLRNTMNRVRDAKFNNPGGNSEKLAFNAFVDDFENGLRNSINQSTNKLGDINKAFTEGMQLVEVMEKEFGTVKFRNLTEVLSFSKKIESMLKKKGVAPEIIDDFFRVIGEDPTAIKAQEAVRGAFGKEIEAEAAGLNPITFIRSLTAGVISPKDATRLTIQLARLSDTNEKVARPVIDALAKLKPAARTAIIRSLVGFPEND